MKEKDKISISNSKRKKNRITENLNRLLLSIIILLILTAIESCEERKYLPTEPDEQKPPGYQEDIPWPSLADSPWPMYRADPQNTGRSDFIGPQAGKLYGYIPANNMEGSVIIGDSSTLYFLSTAPQYLISTDFSGNYYWKSEPIGYSGSQTPIISNDSIIYIPTEFDTVYAFNNKGEIIWKFKADEAITQLSMIIDLAGNLYFIDQSSTLYCLQSDGKLIWKLRDSRFNKDFYSAMAFSPDGTTLYILGNIPTLLAVDIITQNVKWEYGSTVSTSAPIVDSQGNIYIIKNGENGSPHFLISLKPDGNLRWEFEFTGSSNNLNTEPTIDKYGNIYLGTSIIYSVSYDGILRWKYEITEGYFNICGLISDINGNIFIGAGRDLGEIKFFSLNNSGELNWEIPLLTTSERSPNMTPSISYDGKLFFPTFRSENIIVIE